MSTSGDVADNQSELHSARASSMGKSGVSGRSGRSSRSWKMTPSSFEDIDKYAHGGHHKKGAGDDDGGVAEESLVEKMKQNSHVLGAMSLLMLITLLCSIVPALALWLCALQVMAIFASSVQWEEDQVLAKGGKFRACRLLCQLVIVGLSGLVCALLFWVAGPASFCLCYDLAVLHLSACIVNDSGLVVESDLGCACVAVLGATSVDSLED